MSDSIKPHAKLIEALAETMENNDWATDILSKCSQIEGSIAKIRAIASSRLGGER